MCGVVFLKYLTHFWKAKNANVHLFYFEYGSLKKIENEKPAWQAGKNTYKYYSRVPFG
jgi:hypothetical protein